ncbi:dTDP-4-dehydrorhamnose reductase [Candidatus Marinamargulisbacteria bacterium SCGC AG-410-N11]|nr:dTDP-4-dehydrorhamnose reductase [Candidatus Marinamargulisbacteria bacterium SCGC AG-410-N11]
MKVILIGNRSMLGQDIFKVLSSNNISIADFSSDQIDITSEESIKQGLINCENYDYLINCAAYTKVDLCEKEFDLALDVNSKGVHLLANWCFSHNVILMHFSTDYVFNGKQNVFHSEDCDCDPINKYGLSKLRGEQAIKTRLERYYIFRVQWLYGCFGHHFVRAIVSKAKQNDSISIVNDQWGSPTWTLDIANMIKCVIDTSPSYGVYHFRSFGTTTWYEFGCYFLKQLGIQVNITPVSSNDFSALAKRPSYGCLSIEKWTSLNLYQPFHWQTAVNSYLELENNFE